MSTIIKAEHISYSYPGDEEGQTVEALRDVSFSIEEGEFVAILGHNGCGKSTLAKILCMIFLPGEGKLYIDGKDMTEDSITEEDINNGRRKVGMVFQNPDNQLVATIVEEDIPAAGGLGTGNRGHDEICAPRGAPFVRRTETAGCHCGCDCHAPEMHYF